MSCVCYYASSELFYLLSCLVFSVSHLILRYRFKRVSDSSAKETDHLVTQNLWLVNKQRVVSLSKLENLGATRRKVTIVPDDVFRAFRAQDVLVTEAERNWEVNVWVHESIFFT